jgi:predicted ATPase
VAFLRSVTLKATSLGIDGYPLSIPSIRGLGTVEFHPRVTFLVGENGTGKSTLLEAVAVATGFNPEGGTRNLRFSTRASHSSLADMLTLARGVRRPKTGFFLRSESFFNVATAIEHLDAEPGGGPPIIDSYGGRSLHEQSHGESFFALFMNRFGPDGLYLLDEPEAALSPMRQLAFLRRLHELVRDEGCQFLIATHSPILMGYPDADILLLSEAPPRRVALDETEHFQVSRAFYLRREKLLTDLLGS